MSMRPPQIVAFGGGGFSMESGNPLLDDYVLEATGVERPKVCFIPTASGDADHYVVRFSRRFASVADTSHVSLFRRDKGAGAVEGDLESHLLDQDLIYVRRRSALVLLGTWRAHGLAGIIKRAWRRGVLLCGLSAGSLCWFSEAVTAFHGPPEPVRGLGLLPHSNCVHYDGEAARAEVFKDMIASGQMREGYAAEDGAALHFEGRELLRVVSSRPNPRAYRVSTDGEHQLSVDSLGQPDRAALAVA